MRPNNNKDNNIIRSLSVHIPAAYCYRQRGLTVCQLGMAVCPAATADPIDMPFEVCSFLRQLSTWHCPRSPGRTPLLLGAAVQQSIDIFRLARPQQQTCSIGVLRLMGQTTDGRTDGYCIVAWTLPHNMRAVSVTETLLPVYFRFCR